MNKCSHSSPPNVKNKCSYKNQRSLYFGDNVVMKKINTAETLVLNLKHLMILFDMDAESVSKKSGLTKRAINYYLSGDRVPSIEKAEQIASAFGLQGWHLIMPNLPNDIEQTKHLNSLVKNYLTASSEGKGMIDMVAEREAKYGE